MKAKYNGGRKFIKDSESKTLLNSSVFWTCNCCQQGQTADQEQHQHTLSQGHNIIIAYNLCLTCRNARVFSKRSSQTSQEQNEIAN